MLPLLALVAFLCAAVLALVDRIPWAVALVAVGLALSVVPATPLA